MVFETKTASINVLPIDISHNIGDRFRLIGDFDAFINSAEHAAGFSTGDDPADRYSDSDASQPFGEFEFRLLHRWARALRRRRSKRLRP